MSQKEMTKEKFEELVASYGAKQANWPVEYRGQMVLFVQKQPECQALLSKAAELDSLLDCVPSPQPASESFMEKLSMMPPAQPQAKPKASKNTSRFFELFNLQGFMPRAVGLASVCALGIVLGLSDVARVNNTVISVDAGAMLYGQSTVARDLKEIN